MQTEKRNASCDTSSTLWAELCPVTQLSATFATICHKLYNIIQSEFIHIIQPRKKQRFYAKALAFPFVYTDILLMNCMYIIVGIRCFDQKSLFF